MISLIICSRTASLSPTLEDNIKETIGVDYELIVIDNLEKKYSIFEAYNIGVEKSKYPVLCFMHDDISYHTTNWGKVVLNHFADEKTGAIGIAGSPYAPAMPGSWWGGEITNTNLLNGDGDLIQKRYLPASAQKNEVILLDGVWICIRKSLFNIIRFDDINYNGFHFYDVDTCMQISIAGYKIYCVFDVLIRHYTKGNNMNHNWIENAGIFAKKWQRALPLSCISLSYAQRCEAELKTLKEYVYSLIYDGQSKIAANKIGMLRLFGFYKGYFYRQTPIHLLKYGIKCFWKPNS